MTYDPEEAFERRRGYGFLALMRWLERRAKNKPRIGQNRNIDDDIADLGQDPFSGFADSDLSDVDLHATPPRVRPRFLGFFGPFGALPLAMTSEAQRWLANGHAGFTRFTDIFAARFLQLFYRSWSDARPITQFDHPSGGTFPDQLRAFTGDADASFRDKGVVDDIVRLRYTALQMGRVRSPVRLQQILSAHFGVAIEIEEFAVSWLDFEDDELSCLGYENARLGENAKLGNRMATTEEKAVIHIRCKSNEEYVSFLPKRQCYQELVDLVRSYFGVFYLFDVKLWLPRGHLKSAQLGVSVELGWMAMLPADSTTKETNDSPAQADHHDWVQLCSYQIDFMNHDFGFGK